MGARFCTVLGAPTWTADPKFATRRARLAHAAELDRLVEGWTSRRDAYELMAVLQAAGIAAGVVQNIEDQFRHDRQLAARHFFETIEHHRKGTVLANGIPLGLTRTPGRTGCAGAAVGEDNDYVFGEILGLSEDERAELHAAGADVFLVEEIERGETDVGHFLFAKNEAVIGRAGGGLRDIGSRHRGRGCACLLYTSPSPRDRG